MNPELLIPEAAFRSLIRQLIATFDSPWKQLVTLIYDEMVNALHKVKDPKLDKYERLKDFIISRMIEFFSECKRNALIHVENIIEWEDAYINVEHDDLVHLKDICTMKDISDNDKEKIYYALDMLKIKKTLFNGALKLADHLLEDEHEEFILKNDAPQINILEDDNSVNKAKVFEEQKEVDDTLGNNQRELSNCKIKLK